MHNYIKVRKCTPQDYKNTERLAKAAFNDRRFLPDDICNEHLVWHQMRLSDEYLPELDYVATDKDGRLLGQITWSRAYVESPDGTRHPAVTFGPLSVLPEWQNKGVGTALVEHTLALAKGQGHAVAVLMGHPQYYPRFGFVPAAKFGITDGAGNSHDACMAMELVPGALAGISGRIVETAAFETDNDELDAFNATF